jgi:hypothetical protein
VERKQGVGERRRKKGRKKFREIKTGMEERKWNVEKGGGKHENGSEDEKEEERQNQRKEEWIEEKRKGIES